MGNVYLFFVFLCYYVVFDKPFAIGVANLFVGRSPPIVLYFLPFFNTLLILNPTPYRLCSVVVIVKVKAFVQTYIGDRNEVRVSISAIPFKAFYALPKYRLNYCDYIVNNLSREQRILRLKFPDYENEIKQEWLSGELARIEGEWEKIFIPIYDNEYSY